MIRPIAAMFGVCGLFAGWGVLSAFDEATAQHASTSTQTRAANPKRVAIAPVTVSPGAGSGLSQRFTFALQHGDADLSAVDVLMNTELNGTGACYLTIVPTSASSGYVSLVDDSRRGYAHGSPMLLPSVSGLQNSQCTIHGAGSSFSASDNTSTLTLDVTFAPGFAGHKIIYTAARSRTHGSSWQVSGTWNVPGPVPQGPAVGGVDPGRSATTAQTYAFTYTDTNGFGDLAKVDVLANDVLATAHACHATFTPLNASSGYLYLADDSGDGYVSGSPILLPSSGSLRNSQCAIHGPGSSVSANGNTLTLNLATEFASSFAGNRVFYSSARNHSTGNSGWQPVGSLVIGDAVSGSYSTNFPLIQNPVSEGGNWVGGSAAGGGLWGDVQTIAGLAFGVSQPTQYGDPTAILTGSWGPNQTVQGTVAILSPLSSGCCTEVELRLRTTISSNSITGYEAYCSAQPGLPYCHVARWNGPNGSYCNLDENPPSTFVVNGDVLMATVSGTNPVIITMYKNGTQILQATDTGAACDGFGAFGPWTSGNPGLGFYDTADSIFNKFGFLTYTASDGSGISNSNTPSVPANLSAAAASSSQINLSWTASSDPNYLSSQLTYIVYRNGVAIGTTAAGAVSWADTNLAASTTYSYAVAASDPAGGQSAQSSAVFATTLGVATVGTPTFSPGTGSYSSAQSVQINTTTPGATIRYTTDGSTPSETLGTVYSTAVSVGSTMTLRAIAYKAGMTDSSVATANYTIVVGNVNSGGGHPDLIWLNNSTRQAVGWYMGGVGGTSLLGTNWISQAGVPGWTAVAVADFNRDGVPDILWQNDSTRQVIVWYMGGTGGATLQSSASIVASEPGWHVAAAADFNRDGVPDIVWVNDTTRQVTVWYMGGSGGASLQSWAWINSGGEPGWNIVAAADFNGDGVPDILWQNDSTRQVTLWYMGGGGGAAMQSWAWIVAGGEPGWHVAAARDLNLDGVPDILWENDSTGQSTIWYMGGSGGAALQTWGWISMGGMPGWSLL